MKGQGQLFRDAYPTYADTDRIPAVRGAPHTGPDRPGGSGCWWCLVALAVLAAGTALGLVKAGIIDKKGPSNPSATPDPRSRHDHRPEGTAGHPDLDRGRHGHLSDRDRRLFRDGGHDHRPLLGEYRRRRTAPDLRGHHPPRQLAEGDPPREPQVDSARAGPR